jgi:hypothetical protein
VNSGAHCSSRLRSFTRIYPRSRGLDSFATRRADGQAILLQTKTRSFAVKAPLT